MKVVIFSPRFDENNGGVICLHRLCHLINEIGIRCEIVFFTPRIFGFPRRFVFARFRDKIFSYLCPPRRWVKNNWLSFSVGRFFLKVSPGDVVVYPEIISGNPLGAENVVRWILYHPGRFTGNVNYGPDDYIVKFSDAWDCESIKKLHISDRLLRVVCFPFDLYLGGNSGAHRAGTAYLRRKGNGKPTCHPVDSICIDGLSHQEISKVFKKIKTFISYDAYSAYSWFAAISGVDSIVVPESGVDIEGWYTDISDRYGLSYGFENLSWARETRELLVKKMFDEQERSKDSVSYFLNDIADYFDIDYGRGP